MHLHLPRHGAAVIGSALMAVAVLSSAPASAQSHTVRTAAGQACPNGSLCLYQNKDLNANGGSFWAFSYNSYGHDGWIYVGNAANDQTTSFINNRVFESGIAENQFQISQVNCADIPGNDGQQFNNFTEFDLSGLNWADQHRMNDSVSSFILKSSNYQSCDAVFQRVPLP